MIRTTLVAAAILVAPPLAAQEATGGPIVTPFEGSFEDAAFALETAIVNRGLVVDHVSHVGEMLARTAADVGADEQLFAQADVYLFCSARISREVMEVDPMNIAHCPYGIFVAERDGAVVLGHRDYPEGAMQVVEDMLGEIVAEAAAF